MNNQQKNKEQLISELQLLQQEYNFLKAKYQKDILGKRHKEKVLINKEEEEEEEEEEYKTIFKTEDKYKTLSQNFPVMLYSSDSDWGVNLISNCEILCGFSSDSFLSGEIKWDSLILAEDWERMLPEYDLLLQNPNSIKQEYRIKTKDNSIRYVADYKSSIFDNENNFIGVEGVVVDITDRKTVEKSLQQSELRYRLLIESSKSGINLLDKSGNFVIVNKMAAEIFEKSPDELVNTNIKDVMPKKMADDAFRTIKKINETGKGIEQEIFIEHLNKYFIENIHPVFFNDGKLSGIQVVTTDITKRKLADNAIKESEKKFSEIFTLNPSGIFLTTHEDGKVVNVNKSFLYITGYSRDEVFDQNSDDLDFWAKPEDSKKVYQKINEEGGFRNLEIDFKNKNGEIRTGLFSCKVITTMGKASTLTTLQDITDLKQVKKDLMESEQKYHSLFQQSVNSILLIDIETQKIVDYNESAYKNLGYTEKEFKKLEIADFEHIDSLEQIKKHRKQIIDKGFATFQTKQITKTGEIRNVIASVKTITIKGKPYLQSIITDITDIENTKIKLKESEDKFQQFFETNANYCYITSPDGKIQDINMSALNVLEYTKDEIIGQPLYTIYSKESQKRATKLFELLKQEEKISNEELTIITKSGKKRAILLSSKAILDKKNNIIYSTSVQIDITKRKLAEQEQEQFKLLVENSSDYISISSLERQILYINEAGRRMIGLDSFEEVKKMKIDDFIFKEDLNIVLDQIILSIKQKGSWKGESRLMHLKTGLPIPVNMNSFIINDRENNQPIAMATVTHNMTKSKQAEEKLNEYHKHLEKLVKQRTNELKTTNKELEAFAYSVSHDLRAPLRHIYGFSELLRKRISNTLDEKSLKQFHNITDAANKMGILIDDLLSFSRIGREEMKLTMFDFEQIIKITRQEMELEIEGRKVIWEIGQFPKVYGDPSLIKMALTNLISNAVKFTSNKKEAKIEIGIESKENEYIFYVQDNGVGFNMKYKEKLFNVFQRLHTKHEFEGTGIGLANVQRIIHRHGGRTWAEGILGEGATFYFTLPKN